MMAEMMGYAQPLRAIGQALEVLRVQRFEISAEGEDYFIRGTAAGATADLIKEPRHVSKIRAVWGAITEAGGAERHKGSAGEPDELPPIELRYTPLDVERLETEGRSRRGKSETVSDANALSQILRCIGAYLSKKSASLLKVTRELESVSIEFETSSGSRMKETFSVKDLYDLWVAMYLQRAGRAAQ